MATAIFFGLFLVAWSINPDVMPTNRDILGLALGCFLVTDAIWLILACDFSKHVLRYLQIKAGQ